MKMRIEKTENKINQIQIKKKIKIENRENTKVNTFIKKKKYKVHKPSIRNAVAQLVAYKRYKMIIQNK